MRPKIRAASMAAGALCLALAASACAGAGGGTAAGDQNKARDMVTEATQPSPGSSKPDARPTHGIRNSRGTPVGTPGAAVMDRSCGAEGRATVRERRYAEALRGSRAARTRSRPKMNSSAGS